MQKKIYKGIELRTVREILELVDYPPNTLVIDFESYYDTEYSLSKMSTIEYVMDSRFELTGCGFKLNDNPEYFIFGDEIEEETRKMCDLWGQNLEGVTIIMQNARFDALVLQQKFDIRPPYIIDTKDLARHYDARMSHRLKDLAKMFKLEAKGDTTQFKGKSLEEIQNDACLLYTSPSPRDRS